MQIDTSKISLPSKTTISGLLSCGIAVCVALLGSGSPVLGPKVISGITVGLGVMKAVVGFLQQDAGSTPAVTPDGTVQDVPSHETPNNPKDIPLPKA